MPLSPDDEKLFHTLANDPETREEMLRRGLKLGASHPAVSGIKAQDAMLAPLQTKIESLEAKLAERERNDLYSVNRAQLRRAPFNFNDEKIAKLEERMREKESPIFPDYPTAAKYFQLLDSPITPNSSPMLDMAGQPVGNEQAPWREAMQSEDPKVNPLKMNRRQRRVLGRKLWQEASSEYKENLANR